MFVNESDLTIRQGTPKCFEHSNGSGATMTKQFCGNCGTQLFGKGSRGASMIHVKVGTIDDASFVRPAMVPAYQTASDVPAGLAGVVSG